MAFPQAKQIVIFFSRYIIIKETCWINPTITAKRPLLHALRTYVYLKLLLII